MRDRKGMNSYERRGRENLGDQKDREEKVREIVIKLYYLIKASIFNTKKKESCSS